MKKAWRWPFAGFVMGALVGATVLTVNVVGARSPGAPRAAEHSFGEILHTPPLIGEAGRVGRAHVRRRLRDAGGPAGASLLAFGVGLRSCLRRAGVRRDTALERAGRAALGRGAEPLHERLRLRLLRGDRRRLGCLGTPPEGRAGSAAAGVDRLRVDDASGWSRSVPRRCARPAPFQRRSPGGRATARSVSSGAASRPG